jgi:predicted DNA binding CopG/RHH family protein
MTDGQEIASEPEDRLQELAEYFDRTDATDSSWDEASDVVIERPELAQISLRLPKDDLIALKRRSARTGVGYTTLIRMIVRQYLHHSVEP